MSENKDAQEPSMEEILSSIRRIIADEEKDRPASMAPSRPTPPAAQDDDILELTDLAEDEPAPRAPSVFEPPVAAVPVPPAAAPSPAPPAMMAAPALRNDPIKETTHVQATKEEAIMSAGTASASTNAFSKLTRAAAVEERPASPATTRSVDDLMTELLRPMLKDWLDQNLPAVVERVVEQEVKKLARRAELM